MINHPITPPAEWVEHWRNTSPGSDPPAYEQHIAIQAARWGADEELRACIAALKNDLHLQIGDLLLAARRQKPVSLKQRALERCNSAIDPDGTIRRALEQLPD